MTSPASKKSAVLLQNQEQTVFIIDIPHSIEAAQEYHQGASTPEQENPRPAQESILNKSNGHNKQKRYLISGLPRQVPFPSTEPKTESARRRVLETIPLGERRYHGKVVQPLVRSALEELQTQVQSEGKQWCLSRRTRDVGESGKRKRGLNHGPAQHTSQLGKTESESQSLRIEDIHAEPASACPPVILSSSSRNEFESMAELQGIVKNTSPEPAVLTIGSSHGDGPDPGSSEYLIPPHSTFLQCTLPLDGIRRQTPIPGIPASQEFNLILFDPPWPNRSVRRGSQYDTHPYAEMSVLTNWLRSVLQIYSYNQSAYFARKKNTGMTPITTEQHFHSTTSLAAIWITNSEKARRAAYEALVTSGFRICEEWIWIKITANGEPVSPLDGLWRRPYEILVIGQRDGASSGEHQKALEEDVLDIDPSSIKRRVIAGVPDLHSRKPNLKCLFEEVFFKPSSAEHKVGPYSALEVFARNLTGGWWACGNEVLKFNARECWIEDEF